LQSPPVRFVTLLSQIGFQFSKIQGSTGGLPHNYSGIAIHGAGVATRLHPWTCFGSSRFTAFCVPFRSRSSSRELRISPCGSLRHAFSFRPPINFVTPN